MNSKTFFAVDLGATSGRTIIGTINDGKVTLNEVTRFKNPIIELNGHFFWDLYALYNEVVQGLKKVAQQGVQIDSIGIDTWGVDFAFFGEDGLPLGNPFCYRDPHTEGIMEQFFQFIPKHRVYEKTGIQFMNFNSLFQLFALKQSRSSQLQAAKKILFIPDALSYLLTGKAVCEYTILSTSQLLDPVNKTLDAELLNILGLNEQMFGKMVQPGTTIGTLSPELQKMTGLGAVPVIAVAGHDTASAVAAVPAKDEHFAYLSSGTWSLMGIETPTPIISTQSYDANFTNEGGIEGTTRFLKNICGMWLLERCRKEWDAPDDYALLREAANQCTPFKSLIHPDSPCFANPTSMIEAIQNYCRTTGQAVPTTYGELTRCIFDSLALRYRQVFNLLKEMAPFSIECLHIIGGGIQNKNLNQFTANAVGVPVHTGPIEGTALGNIMMQAKAMGVVDDVWQMRHIIAQSIEMEHYLPQDKAAWDEAYQKYCTICRDNL